MIIYVTHKDIEQGRIAKKNPLYSNPEALYKERNNPISFASSRAGLINPHISCYIQADNYEKLILPDEAFQFMLNFNLGYSIFPFDFEIPDDKLIPSAEKALNDFLESLMALRDRAQTLVDLIHIHEAYITYTKTFQYPNIRSQNNSESFKRYIEKYIRIFPETEAYKKNELDKELYQELMCQV